MRIKENKFLLNDIYKQFQKDYPNGVSLSDFCCNWDKQNYLEIAEDEPEKILSDNCIKAISDTISSIQNIIKRPKTFIKSIEEKTPVETAKKINSQAISRLSRDSNDWYARTFLTVKPKKISSDINYEKLDIYENKVVKNLIDKIYYYLLENNRKLLNLSNKANANAVQMMMKNKYGFANFDGEDTLFKRFNQFDVTNNLNTEELDKRVEMVRKLIATVALMKGSDFCRDLKKTKKVSEPIRKTNIFMYDKRYKKCFDLWHALRENNEEEDVDFVDNEEIVVDDYYFAYVVICVIASMYNNNYKIMKNPILSFDNNKFRVSDYIEWQTKFNNIKLVVDSDKRKLDFSYCIDAERNKWDDFEIQIDYTNFEGMDRLEILDKTDSFIDSMLKTEKYNKISSKYYIVSIDFSTLPDIGERLYKRFFSIGDNYDEKEPRIKEIGNYHTGIIIVTPLDVRQNSLNIQRIINSHIYRAIDYKKGISCCPICGNPNIRVSNGTDIICKKCKHMISFASSCSNCKEKHIVWIRFDENKFLKDADLRGKLANDLYYYQLQNMQRFMKQYAITSFSMENNDGEWVLKTVCPHCGKKLGEH